MACAQVRNLTAKTGHTTLAQALLEAQAGDSIKLDADLTERDVQVPKSVTIDGGGQSLHGALLLPNPSVSVTVKNLTVLQDNPANGILAVGGNSSLTVEACSILDYSDHSGIGLLGSGNTLLVRGTTISGCNSGIHSPDGRNQIEIIDSILTDNEQCLRSSAAGDHWKIKGGELKSTGESPVLLEQDGSSYEISPETKMDSSMPRTGGKPLSSNSEGPGASSRKDWPIPKVPPGKHLWDLEPTLASLSQRSTSTHEVPPTDPQPIGKWLRGRAVNLSNKQLKVTLWGKPEHLTLSLGKTDVWDRRAVFEEPVTLEMLRRGAFSPNNKGKVGMGFFREDGTVVLHPESWLAYDFPTSKPAGQVTLLAQDFVGAPQPEAVIRLDDGSTSVHLRNGNASLEVTFLTQMARNVVAIHAKGSGLSTPLALRLFRHQDTSRPGKTGQYISAVPNHDYARDFAADPGLAELIEMPASGTDGEYFWIHQKFPAEKTFPNGFEYFLVGLMDQSQLQIRTVNGEKGLGIIPEAPAPLPNEFPQLGFQPDYSLLREALGSSVTATLPKPGQEFTAYMTVVTNNDTANPFAAAKDLLRAARKEGLENLRKANKAWYHDFYAARESGRVFSGSEESAEQWLKSTFRSWTSIHSVECNPDPAKLEADAPYAWMESDQPNWHNVICYNDVYDTPWQTVLNRADRCSEWFGLFKNWLPAARENARAVFDLPGWYIGHGYLPPVKSDKYYHTHTPLEFSMEISAQVLKPLWDTWDYSGDEAMLRETVYPLIRDLANFYAGYVTKEGDGRYHVIPTVSSEHHGVGYEFSVNKNSASGLSFIKWTLRSAADAAELLNLDGSERTRWREISDNLAPYPTWDTPDGPVVTDIEGINPLGKSFNHFAGWLPVILADDVTLDSDAATKEVYLRSARVMGQRAWHTADVPYLLGGSPDAAWDEPNWFQKIGPGMNLDNAANLQATILDEPERLLNSRSGRIHLFPSVPASATIAFRDFQARGGFLVSAEMISGKPTFVEVSARRSIPCQLMNPWPGQETLVRDKGTGKLVEVKRDRSNGDCLVFGAKAGTTYEIIPAAKLSSSDAKPKGG